MNLHALAVGIISSVNPHVPASVQVSIGNTTSGSGKRTPQYATPGSFTGSISGTLLTISAATAGAIKVGQALAGAGISPGTVVTGYGSGTGGVGTYNVNKSQTVASTAIATTLTVPAQVQSLTFRDLQQIEGLNLQGTRRAIYFYGSVDGIVREDNKGGDLVVLPDGTTWLVALVLESWPNWCKVAATLQNGG